MANINVFCSSLSHLQAFNTPLGYCFMLCLVSLIQGMTAFGFVFIGLSTLEKRFFLNSLQTGSISSAYDFSSLIIAVIVSYMGERGHRPLWVGYGCMLFCAGKTRLELLWIAPPPPPPTHKKRRERERECVKVGREEERFGDHIFVIFEQSSLFQVAQSYLYPNIFDTTLIRKAPMYASIIREGSDFKLLLVIFRIGRHLRAMLFREHFFSDLLPLLHHNNDNAHKLFYTSP